MGKDAKLTEVAQQYSVAHAAHYGAKNLRGALGLYKSIITAHPGTPEAEYSRSQIQNIVKNVVPGEELLEAQIKLASTHCGRGD